MCSAKLLVQQLTETVTMGPDLITGRTVVTLFTAFATDHLYVHVWQDRFVSGEVLFTLQITG